MKIKYESTVTTGWKTRLLKQSNFSLSLPELILQNGTKAKGHICHHRGNTTTPDWRHLIPARQGAVNHTTVSLPLYPQPPMLCHKDRPLNWRGTRVNFIIFTGKDHCLRGRVAQPFSRKKRQGSALSLGLCIYLCKPAYERTGLFALRPDLRAANQRAVPP